MRLTDLAIQKLPYREKGQKTFWDDLVPAFGVRVGTRTKSFVVMHGSGRLLKTLGRYPALQLKTARAEAKRFFSNDLQNPATITVSDAREAYLDHCRQHNRPRTVWDYSRLLNRHLPPGRLAGLDRPALLGRLDKLRDTPGEQSHAYTAISIFLNWCVARGYILYNPIAGIRRVGKIEKRARVLMTGELRAVWAALDDEPYPFGPIVKLLILTGQRKGEIGALRWAFIKDDVIALPGDVTKNGHEHRFPIGELTKSVMEIVRKNDDGLLFPGRTKEPWNGWYKSKDKLDKKVSIAHWTLHDLRRTFATVHAEIGTPIHVTEKLLNHRSGTLAGVAGIYNRHTYLPEMRQAVETYEAYIARIAGLGQSST